MDRHAPGLMATRAVFTKTTLGFHLKGQSGPEIKELIGMLTENLASELQHALEGSQQLVAV